MSVQTYSGGEEEVIPGKSQVPGQSILVAVAVVAGSSGAAVEFSE